MQQFNVFADHSLHIHSTLRILCSCEFIKFCVDAASPDHCGYNLVLCSRGWLNAYTALG